MGLLTWCICSSVICSKCHFQAKQVLIFLPWKYDVISQLRHSHAKGPFCLTRLNLFQLCRYPSIIFCPDACGAVEMSFITVVLGPEMVVSSKPTAHQGSSVSEGLFKKGISLLSMLRGL